MSSHWQEGHSDITPGVLDSLLYLESDKVFQDHSFLPHTEDQAVLQRTMKTGKADEFRSNAPSAEDIHQPHPS